MAKKGSGFRRVNTLVGTPSLALSEEKDQEPPSEEALDELLLDEELDDDEELLLAALGGSLDAFEPRHTSTELEPAELDDEALEEDQEGDEDENEDHAPIPFTPPEDHVVLSNEAFQALASRPGVVAPPAPAPQQSPPHLLYAIVGLVLLQIVVLIFVLNMGSRIDVLSDQVAAIEAPTTVVVPPPQVAPEPPPIQETATPQPIVEEAPPVPSAPVEPEPPESTTPPPTLAPEDRGQLARNLVGGAAAGLTQPEREEETVLDVPTGEAEEALALEPLVLSVREALGTMSSTCNTFKKKSLRIFNRSTGNPSKFWLDPTQSRAQPHGAKVVELRDTFATQASTLHARVDPLEGASKECVDNLHGAIDRALARCFETGSVKSSGWTGRIGRDSCGIE